MRSERAGWRRARPLLLRVSSTRVGAARPDDRATGRGSVVQRWWCAPARGWSLLPRRTQGRRRSLIPDTGDDVHLTCANEWRGVLLSSLREVAAVEPHAHGARICEGQ